MNFLKGLAISLLSFLLFLSLAILGFVFMLDNTLLDPDFVVAQADKIPISSLIRELTEEQISGQLPEEAWFLKETMYNVISDQEPWIKEQVSASIYSFYDFLLRKTERLSLIISLEPLKESLRDSLRQTFMQSLPPQLSGLPQAEIEKYFDESYQQISEQIPSELRFDEHFIPPEVMAQFVQVRQYISYAQTIYYALIGFMVLLILVIILLNRNIRSAARGLGITFLTYGAFEYAGIWVTKYLVPTYLPLPQIPSSLQAWLLQFINDFLAPLEMFSLGLLAGGVVLLIVSFVYKPRVVEE